MLQIVWPSNSDDGVKFSAGSHYPQTHLSALEPLICPSVPIRGQVGPSGLQLKHCISWFSLLIWAVSSGGTYPASISEMSLQEPGPAFLPDAHSETLSPDPSLSLLTPGPSCHWG